jgi:hypothetical protein
VMNSSVLSPKEQTPSAHVCCRGCPRITKRPTKRKFFNNVWFEIVLTCLHFFNFCDWQVVCCVYMPRAGGIIRWHIDLWRSWLRRISENITFKKLL